MTFVRSNPLSWAMFETFTSTQCNLMDLQGSRAIDGYAGGTYNPSAALIINNQFEIDSTGAAAANVIGLVVTGKGTEAGIEVTGGASDGDGIQSFGGATDGRGIYAAGANDGAGGYFVGGTGNANGVIALAANAAPMITETDAGLLAYGSAAGGKGILAVGTGGEPGIDATGGATNAAGGNFTGGGTGQGVRGTAGATGGRGVAGYGTVSGEGVYGIGGPTDGTGVKGTGQGAGSGVQGTGGATNAIGVEGTGGGAGIGVKGTGGASSGYGGTFIGGVTNGPGIYAEGKGTGEAIYLKVAAGAPHISMLSVPGDPTVPAEGDIWADSTDAELITYLDSKKHQLLDTWALGTITGGGAPGIGDQNNVSGITSDATSVTVNFSRSFGSANIAPVITIGGAGIKVFPVISNLNVGYVTFQMYDSAGTLVVPTAGATNLFFGIVVKGAL